MAKRATRRSAWYSGDPGNANDGYEFGQKPFDPFFRVPDDQNEDNEWFFGLANPFKRSGNDVIDATNLFAGVTCGAAACDLPTVGIKGRRRQGDAVALRG